MACKSVHQRLTRMLGNDRKVSDRISLLKQGYQCQPLTPEIKIEPSSRATPKMILLLLNLPA